MSKNIIPEKYRGAAIPYLNVINGFAAVQFYKQAFNAEEVISIPRSDEKLAHGELKIYGATIMLREELPELNFLSPVTIGGTPMEILIYVPDIHAFVTNAVDAGAVIVEPIKEQFHGDLMAILKDPFGFEWFFAMRTEELSKEELKDKAKKWGV